MRTLSLLLLLSACAPPLALQRAGNDYADMSPSEGEAANTSTEEETPEALGVTNGTVGDDLLPPMQIGVLTGHCGADSWVSGPLVPGGKRQRLKCETVTVTYLERKPGYTDSGVSILQRDENKRISLGTRWESEDRLIVHNATLGNEETIKVSGSCTGHFVRPPDSYFAAGGSMAEISIGMDNASDESPQPRETLACTVNDLQGNPIGAITFATR